MINIRSCLFASSAISLLLTSHISASELQKEIIEYSAKHQPICTSNTMQGILLTDWFNILEGRFKKCSDKQREEMMASAKKLQQEKKHTQALKKFTKVALHGFSEAMFLAGLSSEYNSEPNEAVRWYFLAFFNEFIDSLKRYPEAEQALVKCSQQSFPFNNFLSFFSNINQLAARPEFVYSEILSRLKDPFMVKHFSDNELALLRYRLIDKLLTYRGLQSNDNFSIKDIPLNSSQSASLKITSINIVFPPDFHQHHEELALLFTQFYPLFRPELSPAEQTRRIVEILYKVNTPDSRIGLGVYYANDQLTTDEDGKTISKEERLKRAYKAFKEGKHNVIGRISLANLYADNKFPKFKKSRIPKKKRINKAFNLVNGINEVDALDLLGKMYLSNELPENISKSLTLDQRLMIAKDYFIKANTPDSSFQLALMYLDSTLPQADLNNLTQDDRYKLAFNLLHQSSTPQAHCEIGKMFLLRLLPSNILEGKDADYLYEESYNYLQKSGTFEAIIVMGLMFENLMISQNEKNKLNGPNDHLIKAKEKYTEINLPIGHYHLARLFTYHPTVFFNTQVEAYEAAYPYAVQAQTEIPDSKELTKTINSYLKQIATQNKENNNQEENRGHLQGHVRKRKVTLALESEETKTLSPSNNIPSVESAPFDSEKNASNSKTAKAKPFKGKSQILAQQSKEKKTKEELLNTKKLIEVHDFKIAYAEWISAKAFEKECEDNKKLSPIMDDIIERPWELKGEGQPEILRYKIYFKGQSFTGCFSRRLNAVDRLVYKVENGEIKILSWKGHYE